MNRQLGETRILGNTHIVQGILTDSNTIPNVKVSNKLPKIIQSVKRIDYISTIASSTHELRKP